MIQEKTAKEVREFADFEAPLIAGLLNRKPLARPEGPLTDLIQHVVKKALSVELDAHIAEQAGLPISRSHSPPVPAGNRDNRIIK
ncbi:MAG: hypothetical protein WBA17_08760 [Saprospiraceae bacterium]